MRWHEIQEDPGNGEFGDMAVFYHGTSKAKLPEIMRHGLDPQLSGSYENEMANWPDDPDGYYFIYLARSRHTAQSYMDCHSEDGGGVMLKITLPLAIVKKLVLTRGEFIRCPVVIPPEYIEVAS